MRVVVVVVAPEREFIFFSTTVIPKLGIVFVETQCRLIFGTFVGFTMFSRKSVGGDLFGKVINYIVNELIDKKYMGFVR